MNMPQAGAHFGGDRVLARPLISILPRRPLGELDQSTFAAVSRSDDHALHRCLFRLISWRFSIRAYSLRSLSAPAALGRLGLRGSSELRVGFGWRVARHGASWGKARNSMKTW
jgi:hypothetical protein